MGAELLGPAPDRRRHRATSPWGGSPRRRARTGSVGGLVGCSGRLSTRPPSRLRSALDGPDDASPAASPRRRLRGAHQAPHHRAAAGDHGAHDGRGRQGVPSLWLMVATVVGGTLAAGGANAINMYVDRDIDAIMKRTRNRPLVTGVLEPRNALIFAVTIEVVAFVWLWALVNLLSAVLAVVGLPLLRVRLHAVAQAHVDQQHRHRRRRRRRSRAHRLVGRHRPAGLGARWCCSGSCSSGRRRTSGRSPSGTRTTTPRPTCPCCPSVASLHTTAVRILSYTVVVWAPQPGLRPGGGDGRDLRRVARWPSARGSPGWPSWCCEPSRPRPPCGCSPTPSPTSRCCSPPWPSTCWFGMASEPAGVRPVPGVSADPHRMCRVPCSFLSGADKASRAECAPTPGPLAPPVLTTRSSLN